MSAAITAAVGGAVVGGIISSSAQKSAAKKAASAQITSAEMGIEYQEKQLEEQQRQFDIQMEEYQRKQSMLEQNYAQMQQQLLPYVQAGQGALYEQMALAGVAAPASPIQPTRQIQPGTGQEPFIIGRDETGGIISGIRKPTVPPEPGTVRIMGGGGPFAALAPVTQAITDVVRQPVEAARETIVKAPTPTGSRLTTTVSPYAGMTGTEAQTAAIEKISQSPLLQELMRQGEEGILQQAAATGGLRGGNIQGALAQFRPQMLQEEIQRQYERLGGLSVTGQQSILQTPTVSPGAMPSYPGMDTSVAQLIGNIGEAQAAQAIAQGKAQGQLWGGIGTGAGLALGSYLNRPQTSTVTGQGGMQAVINPDGTISYY